MKRRMLNNAEPEKEVSRFDSIIFDLDGTLWDAAATCAKAWNKALIELELTGRVITAENIRSVTGMPFDSCVQTLFSDFGSIEIEALSVRIDFHENQLLTQQGGHLYAGVSEGLKRLSSQYELFIVSNCQSWYLQLFLEQSGLRSYFVAATCHGDCGVDKSAMITAMRNEHALSNPLYVGDTMGDQVATLHAGVGFGFASYGYGNSDSATVVFQSFGQLVEYFLDKN